ncbi:hypothetical protein HJG54_16525 [Leptolyngbya sp. NK1-12]|uniref:Uncharacterized protein n=1 Tax=Leptolyngbya sp. NK1-12 TaxID=2547451 RepID=A0AA96WFJ3_9CYAN|nr:hypothetical protein [Leptolyngbya sp. NK1-12]MBF2049436.1 hypothetical protein [Elainella sp. C42_A2020_010]WNZ24304.1 hypothetical protein HJG54_16525 [Leptolyngbya sp. NK1-12]
MKPVESPTQIPRFFLVCDRSLTQQQESVMRQRKLLLIALLMTSALFTIVLTSLPQLSKLFLGKAYHSQMLQTLSPLVVPPSAPEATPIVVQIQQPEGASHLTVQIVTTPAQPSAAMGIPSTNSNPAYNQVPTIILKTVSGEPPVKLSEQVIKPEPGLASGCALN